MKTLGDLAKRMHEYAVDLPKEVNRVAVACAEVILYDLVKKTPVDTSNALSNWVISLGTLNGEEIGPHFTGSKGSTYIQSSNAAFLVGTLELKEKVQGQNIFISNSVEYITDLNNGTSKQEPAGFVHRAFLLGEIQVKNWRMFESVGTAPGTITKWIPKGRRQ